MLSVQIKNYLRFRNYLLGSLNNGSSVVNKTSNYLRFRNSLFRLFQQWQQGSELIKNLFEI